MPPSYQALLDRPHHDTHLIFLTERKAIPNSSSSHLFYRSTSDMLSWLILLITFENASGAHRAKMCDDATQLHFLRITGASLQ
jgi:hypothetical protein